MNEEELRQAISGPADHAGHRLEDSFVELLVQDAKDREGALPLLQYALTELFEQRQGVMLTLDAYHEIGGVLGALGRRAETVYLGLGEGEQKVARQLFLRLVALGEGTEDTRRRTLRSELTALQTQESYLPASMIDSVIESYGAARLLSFDRDPVTRGPTVEVAHEALLREWGRLREWLESSRDDVRTQRLLAAATAEQLLTPGGYINGVLGAPLGASAGGQAP